LTPKKPPRGLRAVFVWLDHFQQEHAVLGFPLAVNRKYADDQGGYLTATVAYYGFFSIFPLLLVLTTILGFVFHGNPDLQQGIVDSALGQFPVVGSELKSGSLSGSSLALVGAEVNVVAARGFWPRSLSVTAEQPATRADRDALTQRTRVEQRRLDEEIEVHVPVDSE
jgi:hypothetical protein